MLCTLTPKFDHVVVTIEKTKELSDIQIEDLQGTLEAYVFKLVERNHGKEESRHFLLSSIK
jgi:hypothetical protein